MGKAILSLVAYGVYGEYGVTFPPNTMSRYESSCWVGNFHRKYRKHREINIARSQQPIFYLCRTKPTSETKRLLTTRPAR